MDFVNELQRVEKVRCVEKNLAMSVVKKVTFYIIISGR